MSSQCNIILAAGIKHIPTHGFSNATYLEALKDLKLMPQTVSNLFPRGFPAALTEYVVKSSNIATQQKLEEKFNKERIIELISREKGGLGDFKPYNVSDVVETALKTKLNFIKPYVGKWHEAVSHEYSLKNAPYAIINLAEFADIIAYYMERMESFNKILEPVLMLYAVKSRSSQEQSGEEVVESLRSLLKGIPFSSGPHVGGLRGQLGWTCRRLQVAAVYAASMASLMGDSSSFSSDTVSLVQQLSKTVF